MDRRNHIKLLLTGGLGSALFIKTGCSKEDIDQSSKILNETEAGYGRTYDEIEYDKSLYSTNFFSEIELQMVKIISDIIIPQDDESVSASDAGVVEFIEFMMKDHPPFQLVTKGGLMWLNNQCRKSFGKIFTECSDTERVEMIDKIAWPDQATPDMQYGVRFFNRMRDLTVTGYFTSKIGIDYLGYKGNSPGFWDGVPDEVLENHGLKYDEKTLKECIKEEDRYLIATWDEEMNLI